LEGLPVEVEVEVHNEEVSDIRPMVVPIQSSEQKMSDDADTNQRDTEPVNPTKKKKVVKNITPNTTKARGNSKNSRPKDF
jgi:hypothetical protein